MNADAVEERKAQSIKMLRFPDVVSKTGLSRSAVYERIRSGEFPPPVALGPRAVGFVEGEVEQWLSSLVKQSRVSRTQPQGVM